MCVMFVIMQSFFTNNWNWICLFCIYYYAFTAVFPVCFPVLFCHYGKCKINIPVSLKGSKVILVGATKLPFSHKPLLLYNGELTCQTQSGKTSSVLLSTHSFLNNVQTSSSKEQLQSQLQQAINLKRYTHTLFYLYYLLLPLKHFEFFLVCECSTV